MSLNTLQQIFGNIYKTNRWSNGSGPGSSVDFTKEYRIFLKDYLKDKNIKSILDVGCGDWQFSKELNLDGIYYTGIDVAKICIDNNIKQYASSNIKFEHKDILTEDVPITDLIILKDVLQHLSNNDIQIILDKVSKYKYALITNDICEYMPNMRKLNSNIDRGNYRPLDIRLEPFNFKNCNVVFNFNTNNKTTLEWTF